MIVCTRRRALWMGGAFAASGPLASLAQALPREEQTPARGSRMYAVVRDGAQAGIARYEWNGAAWQQRHFYASAQAGQLVASHDRRRIFVTHAARDAREAAGAVEIWHVEPQTGSLTRGSRQALALSARLPVGVALRPDGRMLAVAAQGGVLSLLPMGADGEPGEVIAAHKHLQLAQAGFEPTSMSFDSPSELHVRCDAQALRFQCDAAGFRYVGVADVRPAQSARTAQAVPVGVVSFVLLPPRSV